MNPRVGLASIGFASACLLGCGLRTDPDFTPVCVDNNMVAVDGTGDTGDTGGTGDTGTFVPRSGSCEDPIDIPAGETIVVRGSLGGCSGTEGWCGGSGAEDVYRIGSVANDVFIDFLPTETNFNPVLRVVRGDPCEEGTPEVSEVCADIVNSIPGRGFYDEGGANDVYYIIVDTELGESGEYAFEVRFGESAFEGDCFDELEEQVIELSIGGNFAWEGPLEAKQGRLDSGCSAPGDEDVFSVVVNDPGKLTATVEVLDGDIEPIVSIRTDCATTTEQSCGAVAERSFNAGTSALLVVDQLGVGEGRYRLNVDYN
jgi:hypothetical protein